MISSSLIRAKALTAVPDVIRELGADPGAFLGTFHLHEDMIGNPKQMIPYLSLIQLMERAAEQFDCQDFGLQVGLKQNLNVLGPIAVIAQNSATAEEALAHIIKYIGYHSPAISLKLTTGSHDRCRGIHFDIGMVQGQARSQTVEMTLAFGYGIMKVLMGPDFRPSQVHFRHARISPLPRYRAVFQAPVQFGKLTNAIYISESDLCKPISHSDPALLQTMEEFVAQTLAQHQNSLKDNVRSLVISLLPLTQRCTVSRIARHLAVSERTLQRGLKKEGVVFEQLVDDIRYELATDYLKEQDMAMSQVAGLLGYGQQSSFNRACIRWFGKSPSAIREQLATD
ncbi:AraC family transcriptional regulator [Marinobacter zhejiangensis]|uniref:AraC-type DNA-binding protein n=1 Tax=Marinobacter zhejiangensis TaxID=488535 RepID=A0A1I4MBC1_9GAMM|nr:AraC family transcriptional regulator [Marinobacter zhejiangensis]SFM00488.1 AraC-type DNA-binding protein [Marinobacter zhejiangensis]